MNTLTFECEKVFNYDLKSRYCCCFCVVAVVDDTNPKGINSNNYSNGAKEGTNESETDTGSPIELVLPSNLFPPATATDDSAETNANAGVSVSSTNGDEPPATTSNLMQ